MHHGGRNMYRKKDFNYMDVLHIGGKKVGFINDLLLDVNEKRVRGFVISSYSMFAKTVYILKEDIISFNTSMIVSGTSRKKYLPFSIIKNMDVRDNCGNILGMVEEIIFEPQDFEIKGLVISTGLLSNFLNGKKIVLLSKLIIGDESLLYLDDCGKINFTSVPHILSMEEEEYEKINDKKNN
jgi:uncharacterized protein YrrD